MDIKQKMILVEVGKKLEEADTSGIDKAKKFLRALNRIPQHLQDEFYSLEMESDGNWINFFEKCSDELLHELDDAIRSVEKETAET